MSGKPVDVTYVDYYGIGDGQIVEVWEVRDGLSLRAQLGIGTAPERPGS